MPETILIVDDGKDNRDFLAQHVLAPNEFNYLQAKDGAEGLQLALQERPDLILLDFQMPRLNGLQVLERLRQENVYIPVILMTLHGSEEIAINVYRLGVKDYVKKPYSVTEMLDAINRALSETRLRKERDELTNRILDANQQLQRRLQQFEILHQIGKRVTSSTDIASLLPQLVDAATRITEAEEGLLVLLQDGEMHARARKAVNSDYATAMDTPIKDRVSGHVLQQQQPILLEPEQLRGSNAPHSLICVPLTVGSRQIGTLQVLNHARDSRVFDQNDLLIVSSLGDYGAIAIENSRNLSALQESKQHVQNTFEQFVPPSVVKEALQTDVAPGGKRQVISVLFADIRGYTTFSERVSPEKVLEVLNHYLSVAGDIIIGWEGTLDKFMGDGLMAIFNAPTPQPDHAQRAAESALAMRQGIEEINRAYRMNLQYSLGIHVGEAVVGYLGTQYNVNYTAIGDTVNLAKRLQEKAAPGQILVSDLLVQKLGRQAQANPVGKIRVKGREEAAMVYELLELNS